MLKTESLDKPLIGAINGRALGGGTEIVLLTDIRIAAEPITAGEALAYGLISEVVQGSRLAERAEELAAAVCRNAPLSMGVVKRTVLATHTMPWDHAFRFEARESAVATRSKDAREGPRAFKERRNPNWTGE